MISLVLALIFLTTAGLLWLQGLWNNLVNVVLLYLSILFAINFYEPISAMIEGPARSYTYLIDFLVLWLVFYISYGFLRLFSDLVGSRERVVFSMPVEMAGRTIMSLWAAWLFVGFVTLTLHTAPLSSQPLGFASTPESGAFFGLAPDRQLLGLAQMASRGSLARSVLQSESPFPEDEGMQVFDPESEFILKYYARRKAYESQASMRVN